MKKLISTLLLLSTIASGVVPTVEAKEIRYTVDKEIVRKFFSREHEPVGYCLHDTGGDVVTCSGIDQIYHRNIKAIRGYLDTSKYPTGGKIEFNVSKSLQSKYKGFQEILQQSIMPNPNYKKEGARTKNKKYITFINQPVYKSVEPVTGMVFWFAADKDHGDSTIFNGTWAAGNWSIPRLPKDSGIDNNAWDTNYYLTYDLKIFRDRPIPEWAFTQKEFMTERQPFIFDLFLKNGSKQFKRPKSIKSAYSNRIMPPYPIVYTEIDKIPYDCLKRLGTSWTIYNDTLGWAVKDVMGEYTFVDGHAFNGVYRARGTLDENLVDTPELQKMRNDFIHKVMLDKRDFHKNLPLLYSTNMNNKMWKTKLTRDEFVKEREHMFAKVEATEADRDNAYKFYLNLFEKDEKERKAITEEYKLMLMCYVLRL